MADNDDDVFADEVDDDGGALDALRAELRAQSARESSLDLAAGRIAYDERCTQRPLPAGWNATPFDLGRPAEHLRGPSAALKRAILYFHGGGFCFGSLKSHRALAAQLGHAAQAEVFTLDYRLAPEHAFPAGLNDCVEAYRRLLDAGQDPNFVVLMGDSAGGNLAFATAVKAMAMGLPAPLGIVAMSPWTDLTLSGDSVKFKAEVDPSLKEDGLRSLAALYLGGASASDGAASPLFANLKGLPPLLIHVGGDELLLSDAERFVSAARAVGVDATVEIWPGLFHVWHGYFAQIEEGREGISEIGAWLKRRWKT